MAGIYDKQVGVSQHALQGVYVYKFCLGFRRQT